jgi:hypothetical protein
MNQWKSQIKLLKEIDSSVREFDESIRPEVFRVLLATAMQTGSAQPALPIIRAKQDATGMGVRQLAPQELIRRCGVSNLTDKALVLAFWLEEHEGRETFTSTDLKDAFGKAREPAPTNTSDVVGRLEAAGKVMKSGASGKTQSYKLTTTGVSEVEKWSSAADSK